MVKQECQKGATIKLNPNTYIKDGYYFKYWEDDFGKTYKDQEYITINKARPYKSLNLFLSRNFFYIA